MYLLTFFKLPGPTLFEQFRGFRDGDLINLSRYYFIFY